MHSLIDRVDEAVVPLLKRWSVPLLRVSLGIVFIWFGALKVLDVSPVVELVADTVYWVDSDWFVPVLGTAEILIGLGLVIGRGLRLVLIGLVGQMIGTFLVFIVLPDVAFLDGNPLKLSVEGGVRPQEPRPAHRRPSSGRRSGEEVAASVGYLDPGSWILDKKKTTNAVMQSPCLVSRALKALLFSRFCDAIRERGVHHEGLDESVDPDDCRHTEGYRSNQLRGVVPDDGAPQYDVRRWIGNHFSEPRGAGLVSKLWGWR